MANPPTAQMSNVSLQGNAPKGTAKRDALCAAELTIQEIWEREKAFECNPSSDEKFIVTFPYPYSNGHLHLGHAFSLTKAVFRAQFERNRGKNSLFPFAFHCTGMPIQAVSSVVLLVCIMLVGRKSCVPPPLHYVICVIYVIFVCCNSHGLLQSTQ